jgi:hypothetical protein
MDTTYFDFIKSALEINYSTLKEFKSNYNNEANKLKSIKYTENNDRMNESNSVVFYSIKEDINIICKKYDIFIIEIDENNNAYLHWCWGLPYFTSKQAKCGIELFIWARNETNISNCIKELLLSSTLYLGKKNDALNLKILIITSLVSSLLKSNFPMTKKKFDPSSFILNAKKSNYLCYSIIYI